MDQSKASNEYSLRQYPELVKKKKTAYDLSALAFMVSRTLIASWLNIFARNP